MEKAMKKKFVTRPKQRYRKTKKIGEGTYGIVYQGVELGSGESVAIKQLWSAKGWVGWEEVE